jgi:hypothetical protein
MLGSAAAKVVALGGSGSGADRLRRTGGVGFGDGGGGGIRSHSELIDKT